MNNTTVGLFQDAYNPFMSSHKRWLSELTQLDFEMKDLENESSALTQKLMNNPMNITYKFDASINNLNNMKPFWLVRELCFKQMKAEQQAQIRNAVRTEFFNKDSNFSRIPPELIEETLKAL